MNTVIFDVKSVSPELTQLKNRLLREGYQISRDVPWGLAKKEGILLVTDNRINAQKAVMCHLACIGYEEQGTVEKMEDVSIVLNGLEGVDAQFLERMYQRCLGIPWCIAETSRLRIRESVPEDFEPLYEIYQHPDVCAYMPGMKGKKEEERERFLAYIREMYRFYEFGMWTVLEKDSGLVIGRAGLETREYRGAQVLEAGYLTGLTWQGRGYGKEVLRAVLDYASGWLEEGEVYAFIHPENCKSIRLAAGLGFKSTEEKGVFSIQLK